MKPLSIQYRYKALTFLIFGLFLLTTKANATIFWTEDWEEPSSVIGSNWYDEPYCSGKSVFVNPLVSGGRAYSGLMSLKHTFTGHQQHHIDMGQTSSPMGTDLGGGCYSGRSFPASDEIWATYYEYMELDELEIANY